MVVDVSLGHDAGLWWRTETNFAEAASTATIIKNMGLITDLTISHSPEKEHVYAIGSQTRRNDPIKSHNYELNFTASWQDAAAECIYEFLNSVIDSIGNSRNSYCLKLKNNVGTTPLYLLIEGATVSSFSIKGNVGDIITAEVSMQFKEFLSDSWAAEDLVTYGANTAVSTVDPELWHGATLAGFGAAMTDISAELQSFTLDVNYNPIRIDNFSNSGKMALQAQGGIEVKFSGSVYGNSNIFQIAGADPDGIITDLFTNLSNSWTLNIDGTHTATLAGFSYDSVSIPIKEKELVIVDFEGTANSIAI